LSKIFALIRHGSYDRQTGDLTPEGKNKVRTAAGLLRIELDSLGIKDKKKIQFISSDSRRAIQTSEIVAKELGVEKPKFHPSLGEHASPHELIVEMRPFVSLIWDSIDALLVIGHVHTVSVQKWIAITDLNPPSGERLRRIEELEGNGLIEAGVWIIERGAGDERILSNSYPL
jgi:phosphohistidine phosphatase SixA